MTGERVAVLAGVRVVELGGMGPGPFAGMMLADHGAEVTVLKRPDYVRRMYEGRSIFDRGKRAEVADLKSDAGRGRALELVAGADVSIEGFRPGSAERLGLGPDDCQAVNPRLVYARMTGWGRTARWPGSAGTTSTTSGWPGIWPRSAGQERRPRRRSTSSGTSAAAG